MARTATMPHDACYKKVKAQYKVFPSARASQAIAKCRKSHGAVRKTESGKNLKRWGDEKWVNIRTGRPCGNKKDKVEYCRPTKRVSSKTPKTRSELSASSRRKMIRSKKRIGMGKRVRKVR